jgi:hypothetical protein
MSSTGASSRISSTLPEVDAANAQALEMLERARREEKVLSERGHAPPSYLERIAQATSPEAARWAATQFELRRRAAEKFALGREMLFTREALEQATHERVARYRASRFPSGALVADLTAGIGADLLALASRGPAIGFELDRERAEYAHHNLEVHGLSAVIRLEDSLAAEWTFDFAVADPARRVAGRRTLRIDEFAPDPHRLAERMASLRLGAIKLSPMLADADLHALGPRLEFLSFAGECREATVWLGAEAEPARLAVHVESGEQLQASDPPGATEALDAFLHEADPAAIRAHALGALCARFNLRPLGDSNGYLTGPDALASPWIRSYRVLHHGKGDARATREALRGLAAQVRDVKVRGAKVDGPAVRRTLKPGGERVVVLAVWPVGASLRHTLLEPIEKSP